MVFHTVNKLKYQQSNIYTFIYCYIGMV